MIVPADRLLQGPRGGRRRAARPPKRARGEPPRIDRRAAPRTARAPSRCARPPARPPPSGSPPAARCSSAPRPRSTRTRAGARRPGEMQARSQATPASLPERDAGHGPSATCDMRRLRLLHGRSTRHPERQAQHRRARSATRSARSSTIDTFTYAWCKTEPVPGEKLEVAARRHGASSRRAPARPRQALAGEPAAGANEAARWVSRDRERSVT